MPKKIDVAKLADGVLAGSRADVAKAITLVESRHPDHARPARQLLTRLQGVAGMTTRVGITGVPGAGKSTFIEAFGCMLIEQGHKVAVLAVDPSSSKTGGSVLGDRTRMGRLSTMEEAFIRPSPSGTQLGGVARATREAMIVVEAAGYDTVIVETVGVGQSEVAVSQMVDTMLMLALTGAGDQLQGIKRGILEVVDVIAVNKADGVNEGPARVTAREYMIAMKLVNTTDRDIPVLTCSAYTGKGLPEVQQAILEHRAYLDSQPGGLVGHRAYQQAAWLKSQVEFSLTEAIRANPRLHALMNSLTYRVEHEGFPVFEAVSTMLHAYAEEVPNLDWAKN